MKLKQDDMRFVEGREIEVKDKDSDPAGRMSLNTVFGDKVVGIRKPSIASQFVYPFSEDNVIVTATGSAAYTIENSMLKVSTGTTQNSEIFLRTRAALRYVPGYEAYLHYTFFMTQPVIGTFNFAGLGDLNDHFSMGYNASGDFGIRYRRNGSDTFISQSQFNKDTVDGNGDSRFELDPTKGNVFHISYGFLGFANITFSVLDSNNKWIIMHIIEYVNSHEETHITNTYLPIFAHLSNGDTTNDITVHSGSIEAGIVDGGGADVTARSFSAKRDLVSTGTNTPLVLFHNKSTFATKTNMIPDLLTLVTASSEGAQNVNIALYKIKASDITTPGTWLDVKTNVSNMEYSVNPTINFAGIANWEFLLPINLAKSDSKLFPTTDFNLLLYPDEYALFVANGNSVVNLAVRWDELF